MNLKRFNGKELLTEMNLNLLHFDNRLLDRELDRFNTVDKLSWHPNQVDKSPYSAMWNNPFKYTDPDGNCPQCPLGKGYYGAYSNTRMIGFSLRNPFAALSIGTPERGSTNISTNSVRFSTRIGLFENSQHAGSQVNAFRHVLWQAEIANKFGISIARQVGNTHEENPFALNSSNLKRTYESLADADQTIDLLNNQIGIKISEDNPNANMQELSLKVLEYYKNNGLWTAIPINNLAGDVAGYRISQTSLSPRQYLNAKTVLQSLNENGFTRSEQDKRNSEGQKIVNQLDKGPKY